MTLPRVIPNAPREEFQKSSRIVRQVEFCSYFRTRSRHYERSHCLSRSRPPAPMKDNIGRHHQVLSINNNAYENAIGRRSNIRAKRILPSRAPGLLRIQHPWSFHRS